MGRVAKLRDRLSLEVAVVAGYAVRLDADGLANLLQRDARLPFHDVTRDSGCSDRVGRGEVELSRSGSARKVAVLRADRDLIRALARAGTSGNAGTAARFDERRAHLVEQREIPLLLTVLP